MPLKKQNKTLAEQEAVSHEKPAAKRIVYSHQWMGVKATQNPKFVCVCLYTGVCILLTRNTQLGKQLK